MLGGCTNWNEDDGQVVHVCSNGRTSVRNGKSINVKVQTLIIASQRDENGL